jgi:6-pyruvoyltetrahydropterin/6-carboxytetrahydropterin synthase
MVTDIAALDRLVNERVVQVFDGQDLSRVLEKPGATGHHLAENIWQRLVSQIAPGRLTNVRLVQSRDVSVDYAG